MPIHEFIDVEAALITWLDGKMPGVPASADIPEPRPTTFLTVSQTSGYVTSVAVYHVTVSIRCWAPTRAEANDLARAVMAIVPDMPEMPRVAKADVEIARNDPDLEGGVYLPRWQVVIDLVTR
jgi:hypothetical protein